MFLETQSPAAGGLLALVLPFAVMLLLMYFLMIRPQQAQQKQRQAMLDALKKRGQSHHYRRHSWCDYRPD